MNDSIVILLNSYPIVKYFSKHKKLHDTKMDYLYNKKRLINNFEFLRRSNSVANKKKKLNNFYCCFKTRQLNLFTTVIESIVNFEHFFFHAFLKFDRRIPVCG